MLVIHFSRNMSLILLLRIYVVFDRLDVGFILRYYIVSCPLKSVREVTTLHLTLSLCRIYEVIKIFVRIQ